MVVDRQAEKEENEWWWLLGSVVWDDAGRLPERIIYGYVKGRWLVLSFASGCSTAATFNARPLFEYKGHAELDEQAVSRTSSFRETKCVRLARVFVKLTPLLVEARSCPPSVGPRPLIERNHMRLSVSSSPLMLLGKIRMQVEDGVYPGKALRPASSKHSGSSRRRPTARTQHARPLLLHVAP